MGPQLGTLASWLLVLVRGVGHAHREATRDEGYGGEGSGFQWPRKPSQVLKGQPGGGAKAAQGGRSYVLTWPCPAQLLTLGDSWDIPAPLIPQFWNRGSVLDPTGWLLILTPCIEN